MTKEVDKLTAIHPKKRHMLTEGRALFEFGLSGLMLPVLMRAPRGDNHPVMVLPGFLASDRSTRPLRSFLKLKKYTPYGWGLGRNLGSHIVGGEHLVSDQLIDQVIRLAVKHEQKVSLVGWSLGGILAREVARVIPECVRQVISLGSPFNGTKGAAPVAARIFELLNGDLEATQPDALERIIQPPPVPNSAIFSRTDGVAHWQSCIHDQELLHQQSEHIEVKGSHIGLGHNPQVLWIIANRLAQPEGHWQPFREKALHKIMFPNPLRG